MMAVSATIGGQSSWAAQAPPTKRSGHHSPIAKASATLGQVKASGAADDVAKSNRSNKR